MIIGLERKEMELGRIDLLAYKERKENKKGVVEAAI